STNMIIGLTEVPLVSRTFIKKITRSELFSVKTGGLASLSWSVLVGYAMLGVPLEYLLAAIFMAAPSGLIMAKIMLPETEKDKISDDIKLEKDTETVNVIDAADRKSVV